MLLLVANGIPPDIEKTICPNTAVNEEGAEVESSTILGYDEVDRVDTAITVGRAGRRVEVGRFEWVCDVERIIDIYVPVSVS